MGRNCIHMINGYDIGYGLGLTLAAPYWMVRTATRRKVCRALRERMGRVPRREGTEPAVMIHAVSLGEMNATRGMVSQLAQARPDLRFIISTTTDTGYERGCKLYGDNPAIQVVRYPLDFSGAIRRCLDRLRPAVVVLMELEVWPNFLRHCVKRHIPVVLVNGRMTTPSFRRYRLARPVVRSMFQRLALACVQDETYAGRFAELGIPADRIRVTGTMKFDTASVGETVPGAEELGREVGIDREGQQVWVCGSTGPGEEAIILRVYGKLLMSQARLRLVIVPRHPGRFDEVAGMIRDAGFELVRRSQTGPGRERQASPTDASPVTPVVRSVIPPVILGDTMGELRKFYALADVVFVGRSLVDLGSRQHGSDMIEPAALGKPMVVGPFTGNFAEAMACFRAAEATMVADDEANLEVATRVLLSSPDPARAMGRRACEVVKANQGATARHVAVVLELLGGRTPAASGAVGR